MKLGLLYLHGGRFDGAQVCSYGMLWWVDHSAASPRYLAGGWGGQYVLVVPELDLVIVTTADSYAVPRPLGYLLRRLAQQTIIPAFEPDGVP